MKKKFADTNTMRKKRADARLRDSLRELEISTGISYSIKYCTLLLCTALWCTSCGTDTAATPDSDTVEELTQDSAQPSSDDAANENTAPADKSATQDDDTTSNGAEETDTSVSEVNSHISIEMQEEEKNKTTEDGTVYFYQSSAYPVVTITGNNDAADKINADIRSRVDAFMANTETEEWAKEDLEFYESEDNDYPFPGYEDSLTFQIARADSNVISFTAAYYSFTGGAHGYGETIGVNYNAKTGELIAFSDLSDDPAAFHEDTLAYNQQLAQTESYKEQMFSEESATDGTLESVLYADNVWYLSTSGLVFMSAPYALGPYAAGTIEFIIPYGDLADMGFRNAYTYSDRFVLKLQNNAPYTYDLNGDGTVDSLLLYNEYTEGTDGYYVTIPYVFINDTDFAKDGDTAVREQINQSFSSWAEPALYDLNPDDSYIELMLVSGETDSDDYVYYSHFFRYQEDGALAYLGKTEGDATNPTVDTSQLTVSIE
ncbi:MAG: DUF3298 and DUF4163 domain-containing protein [Eubacterium sp.]|nr:DUF3298 and DUF4163 domain-containing protein [Eubacterium sp.]